MTDTIAFIDLAAQRQRLGKAVDDAVLKVINHGGYIMGPEIKILEDLDFDDIVVSVKAFDVPTMVAAYRRLAKAVPYPLHLGVTEAGTLVAGSIRSTAGMSVLLYEGIGDTIRVSLSEDPVMEVTAGFDILKSLGLRDQGLTLVACPSCGR